MPNHLDIAGEWPSPMTLSRGWAKATARPWNDAGPDAHVKLERGGTDFLSDVTDHVSRLASASVYSPALYPSATRIWARSGYVETHRLEIMERSTTTVARPDSVSEELNPDWGRVAVIDEVAFEGFWRMSIDGLKEALASTKRSALLSIGADPIDGYAVVGAQWNVSYLQRIAVHPNSSGAGYGRLLTRAALAWGRKQAAATMVLNVRDENTRARKLYSKEGFVSTGTRLRILRYEA